MTNSFFAAGLFFILYIGYHAWILARGIDRIMAKLDSIFPDVPPPNEK